MAILTMIMGDSGTGKTYSLRNLNPLSTLLIQVTPKPLPFRSADWKSLSKDGGTIVKTDNWERIINGIFKAPSLGKDVVVIDDMQYMIAQEFMRRGGEKGYDKFTEMAQHTWQVIHAAQQANDNLRVYFTWHSSPDETGTLKPKTIGRMLDEKVCIEGLFTIVLRSQKQDDQYIFSTQSNGSDVCKSPCEMFSQQYISNDLSLVDKSICEFYGIQQQPTGKIAA